ncbi:MAG TPA: VIT1/CCC1 transporter family protein, partial [Actinopolymorphaceae bacterium]
QALLAKERWELENMPEEELDELAALYEAKGVSPALARQVAEELTAHDALRAHAETELGLKADNHSNPWQAAASSFVSFVVGAALPLLAILLPPAGWRVGVCFVAVVLALVLTGTISARMGAAPVGRAVLRTVAGGAFAMAATYVVGSLVGVSV